MLTGFAHVRHSTCVQLHSTHWSPWPPPGFFPRNRALLWKRPARLHIRLGVAALHCISVSAVAWAALLSTDRATQSPSLPQVLPPPFGLAAYVYDPRATLKEFAPHVVQSTAAFAQRLVGTVCALPRLQTLTETAVAEVLALQKPFADNTFP